MELITASVGILTRKPRLSRRDEGKVIIGELTAARYDIPSAPFTPAMCTYEPQGADQGSKYELEVDPSEMAKILSTDVLLEEIRRRIDE